MNNVKRFSIYFSMPRGLIARDFYNAFLVFENEKLTYFLENITQGKIEKEIELEYSSDDFNKLITMALESVGMPRIKRSDVTLEHAKMLFDNGEEKTSFVENREFWKIAKSYIPKN